MSKPLVVIESPFAASDQHSVDDHIAYARRCMADALKRGEAPIASHLIYTQPGILNDAIPEERRLGIDAGFAWGEKADRIAFYIDMGWSRGMLAARAHWEGLGRDVQFRTLQPINDEERSWLNP